MAEFPALPLWTDALLADAGHLSDAAFGCYLKVLILMWRTPGCRVPNDLNWITERLPLSDEALIKKLLTDFCQNDGNWFTQKRLQKEFNYQKNNRKKNSDNAKRRWNKEKDSCDGNATSHTFGNAPTPIPTPPLKGLSKDNPKNGVFSKETLDLAVKAWNALAGAKGLPKVQTLTQARKVSLHIRLSELGGPAGWADLLRKVQASRFLCGENEKGWTADFDWVLKPANLTKIMEGKYDDRKGTSANRSGLAEAFDNLHSRIAESRGATGDSGPDNGGDQTPTEDNRFRNRGDD